MLLTTTLEKLREHKACIDGYNKLVRSLTGSRYDDSDNSSYIKCDYKDDISIRYILDSNELDDALWALRACEQTPELQRAERLFGVWCARQVQHFMTDVRSIDALDVAERYANGAATNDELDAARDAAEAALDASRAAALDAAWAAARAATRAAAWAAALAAAAAARVTAAAARAAQKKKFIDVFCQEKK